MPEEHHSVRRGYRLNQPGGELWTLKTRVSSMNQRGRWQCNCVGDAVIAVFGLLVAHDDADRRQL